MWWDCSGLPGIIAEKPAEESPSFPIVSYTRSMIFKELIAMTYHGNEVMKPDCRPRRLK
jgi:hypothetical protein